MQQAERGWPVILIAERQAIVEPYDRRQGTATVPGIGLGLAITFTLVAQMGGTLGVESEFGTGSSFTIRLRPSDPTASTSTRAP